MNQNRYSHGNANKQCQICGFKYKASELTKRWDGLFVCHYDMEARQPQDTIRSRPDKQRVDVSRPESTARITYWDGTSMVTGDIDPSENEFI